MQTSWASGWHIWRNAGYTSPGSGKTDGWQHFRNRYVSGGPTAGTLQSQQRRRSESWALGPGQLPEDTMVLNNSVLISAAGQEVENDLPFWMTTYNESYRELLSQNCVRAANSASLVRPSDLNFWSHLLHVGISIGRFSPASSPRNWRTERSWREPGFI